MKVEFIAQGLSELKSITAGSVLNKALLESNFESFAAFVAFASVGGVSQLKESLDVFTQKGGKVRLYMGVDLHGTSKEVLELLLTIKSIKTYIVYSNNRIIYHPKVYSFEGKKNNMVIVGSSNLTMSGLYQNVEASICITSDNENEDDVDVVSDIYDYYNSILSDKSDCCQPLSKELIELLYNNKVILTSRETIKQANEISKENQIETKYQDDFKKMFSKIKVASPKVGHKKTIVEKIYSTKQNYNIKESIQFTQTIQFVNKSMWIETRKLTGGSRNILDLSKKGRRDSVTKPGSVEFFGVDKANESEEIDIEIIYNDKVYKGNTIKYAPRNSNWRIQLKGITDDGDKLTYLTKPGLGVSDGFANKILIFEGTESSNRYVLHIIEEDSLEQFKRISADWAYMGNETTGRAYGFFNL